MRRPTLRRECESLFVKTSVPVVLFSESARLGPTGLHWKCRLTNNILWAVVKGFQSSHGQAMKLPPHTIDVGERERTCVCAIG